MLAVFRSSTARYGIAPALCTVAFLLAWAFRGVGNPAATPFFLFAVVLSCWLGGWLQGFICAALATGAALGGIFALNLSDTQIVYSLLWSAGYLLTALVIGAVDSARQRAGDELLRRDVRLQLLGQMIPACLWSTDESLKLTSGFGAGFSAMVGDSPRTIYDHYRTRDEQAAPVAAHRKALAGESSTYDTLILGRTYQAHVEPLRDASGRIVGVVGVALDVTERKREEEGLKAAKEIAEAATQAKDHFLAVLSHELRTPLTPVLAAVSLLRNRNDLDPQAKQDLDLVKRNLDVQTRLIDDLLDLTRIANGKLELRPRVVDAHDVLRDALDVCRHDVARQRLDLTLELRSARRQVRVDPARLQQVLWNLIKNAIKFTPAGGKLAVRTSDGEGGRLRIEVQDSGIGIDPEVLPRIFDAFEQGRSSITRKFGGLGLGLAISKALADALGGRLSASSDGKDRGSTFTVELPTLAQTPSVTGTFDQPVARAGAEETAQASPLTLLLVEDDEDTRKVLARLLRDCGHAVLVAGTVEAAMELLRTDSSVDLMLVDLDLPDGTGFDLLQRSKGVREIQAIALTGHGMESDLARTAAAGFLRHMLKPIDVEALDEAIREVASQPRKRKGSGIGCGRC